MLYYVLVFFVLSILSGFLGFSSLSGTFAQISKVLAVIFLGLLILSLIGHFRPGF